MTTATRSGLMVISVLLRIRIRLIIGVSLLKILWRMGMWFGLSESVKFMVLVTMKSDTIDNERNAYDISFGLESCGCGFA